MESERINLTITGPVAGVVSEMAARLGLSKSAAVASWLTWHLPTMREHLERLRASEGGSADSALPSVASAVTAAPAAPTGSTVARSVSRAAPGRNPGESRAERRRREREERKLGLR